MARMTPSAGSPSRRSHHGARRSSGTARASCTAPRCAGWRRRRKSFGLGPADFPRTRLTHSLECAQIGRELGAALGCDPDLVDAACLAHDMGHPPFGHNGESALAALACEGGALACGGFEGNAQSLRLLTRLEPKVPGAGLNLTRAVLDAALKYPWAGTSGKYGAYESDLAVFSWIRRGAPNGRRCLEAQVMDWADDVAYSVHDVEDGLHAGLITMPALRAAAERDLVAKIALSSYCKPEWLVSAAELGAVFEEFMAVPFWNFSYDGGLAALTALKNLTSELVGRFCAAAEVATLASPATSPRLTRYAADLVVPRRQLLECALLKAVAAHYVMGREGAAAQQAGEREVITELALEIYAGARGDPRPGAAPVLGERGIGRRAAACRHRPGRLAHRHVGDRLAPPPLLLTPFGDAARCVC